MSPDVAARMMAAREWAARKAAEWKPNPGPQTAFLNCNAFECLYGGAAGGGKTAGMLHDVLRDIKHPSYRALLLRKTFPELERNVIVESYRDYPSFGGRYNEAKKTWTFPSGARISFGYLDSERDVFQYQGAEYQYICFDELTHFSEAQYVYLTSRLRSAHGLPVRMRATTNPGGDGHEWVMRRWAPWLDPASSHQANPGEVLHYGNDPQYGERYIESGQLTRTFIPAKLSDTPQLVGSGYDEILAGRDAVTRAQLLDGNWLVKPAAGAYFKRHWFGVDGSAPTAAARVRYWDRAATENGDWTVGLKMARDAAGSVWVEDIVRFRGRPAEVETAISNTAHADGFGVVIGIEEDPGQAGKFEASYYVRKLAGVGFTVRTYRVTKAKIVRAQPISALSESGSARLVRGAWNQTFLDELEAFPEGTHDDQVDALSGAYSALATAPAPTQPRRSFSLYE